MCDAGYQQRPSGFQFVLLQKCFGFGSYAYWRHGQRPNDSFRNTVAEELAMDAAKDLRDYCTDACVQTRNPTTGDLYCTRHG